MKILVSGTRKLQNPAAVIEVLQQYFKKYETGTLVHGGAVGVDTVAGELAKAAGWKVIVYKPNYATHGSAAPLVRNKEMVDLEKPDLLLAFPGKESRGTYHTIQYAKTRSVRTSVHPVE